MARSRRPLAAAVAAMALATCASSARADSVAYLDANEVWVSTIDGTTKLRLSEGEGDWRAVAQGDGGQIVGVEIPAGLSGNYGTFTVWRPDGSVANHGPLAAESGWTSYALPVGLDLTPDGKALVYGYSVAASNGTYASDVGTYVEPVDVLAAGFQPYTISGYEWPTLWGNRVIATISDGRDNAVQHADASVPSSRGFDVWLTLVAPYKLRRTDIAATGKVAALELYVPTSGSSNDAQRVIALAPFAQPGGDVTPADHDCLLPADGQARQPSLSQDGRRIAYTDQSGVHVAQVTDFAGVVQTCAQPAPPVSISPTGSSPSIGPFDVLALRDRRMPPAGGGGGQTAPVQGGGGGAAPGPVTPPTPSAIALPRTLRLKTLSLSLTVPGAGTASVRLRASSKALGLRGRARTVTVATGRATATGAGRLVVALRAGDRRRLARLRGRRVTLELVFAGRRTTGSVLLR